MGFEKKRCDNHNRKHEDQSVALKKLYKQLFAFSFQNPHTTKKAEQLIAQPQLQSNDKLYKERIFKMCDLGETKWPIHY